MKSPHPEAAATQSRRTVAGQPVHRRDVVRFPDGLPGFEGCRSFVLLASPESAPIQQLESVAGPGGAFPRHRSASGAARLPLPAVGR